MSELDKCFRTGQLKKSVPDMEKAKASLISSEENQKDAQVQLDNKSYKWAFIAAYASMFHAARALLFKDGVKERSHFCLYLYVKEKYGGIIEEKYFSEINTLREGRHAILYGDEDIKIKEVDEVEADSAVKIAKGFLDSVKKLIK
ncbi:HEPN domain-containing protein [Candidatus Micrarchaeota archaeon]|nr:HEPN domain-containing protein [Candidatus Micrarchaeota archaeon]